MDGFMPMKKKLDNRIVSLVSGEISAGFPSPAADYEEGRLDLNLHLIKDPSATYFVRASGDSMEGAGISHGDLLIVDQSIRPRDRHIVLASLDGETTVKRMRMRKGRIYLVPENKEYPAQEIYEGMEFVVQGVVTYVIHSL